MKEELRKMCNERAVCLVCKEPVICKFGNIRVHHFAHKTRSNCPKSRKTEEHMRGKSILYDFAKERFGINSQIEIEYYLEELQDKIDVLVVTENKRKIAFEFFAVILTRSK